jgi:hypothetical protein
MTWYDEITTWYDEIKFKAELPILSASGYASHNKLGPDIFWRKSGALMTITTASLISFQEQGRPKAGRLFISMLQLFSDRNGSRAGIVFENRRGGSDIYAAPLP